MTTENLTLWIQAGAVVVAVGASIVALTISQLDRANTRKIASEDRRAALAHAKLMFDLDALLRLLQNTSRGGSTDALEKKRLGAEEMALVGLIGPDLLPRMWERRIGLSDDDLKVKLTDSEEDTPEFVKWSIETQLALNKVVSEIHEIISRE